MNVTTQTTTLAPMEDRTKILEEAVNVTMEAAYGLQKVNDQQIGTMLGNLVRTKLLSADDSYKLKDRLTHSNTLNDVLDSRIEVTLKRQGIITQKMFDELETRLNALETKTA